MKKKAVKKLVLSKETVRGLTDDLRQVRGAESNVLETCSVSNCPYICDAQWTADIWTCMA